MANSQMETLIERGRQVAAAAGHPVLFGVRAHNGTLFVACGGHEWDGSTFEDALDSVVSSLKREANAASVEARERLQRSSRVEEL